MNLNEATGNRNIDALRDLLSELRDKADTNATTGTLDEREAWAGMASELTRALRLANRI
jgi:hypothetical protein